MTPVKNNARLQINIRVGILLALFVVLASLILGKIIYLQYFESESERKEKNNYTFLGNITSERGDILDTKGKLLATSVNTYDIHMDTVVPSLTDKIFSKNIDSLCIQLSEMYISTDSTLTTGHYKEVITKAREKKNRFLEIVVNVTFEEYNRLRGFPIFRLGKYKGGFIATKDSKRELPFKKLMYRTIGKVEKDDITKKHLGRMGLENQYNHILGGIPGSGWMIKLPKSSKMPVSGTDYKDPPVDGQDIITSIDINIQDYAHKVLEKKLKELDAEYGIAVLMEVKTGNIVAMVNLKEDRTDSTNIRYTEQFNYAVGRNMEPGSTFKLPVMIAAMENMPSLSLTDTIDVERGYKKYGSFEFRDSYFSGNTKKSIKDIFRNSSNVGMSKVTTLSFGNDYDKFTDHLYSMGVIKKSQIDIYGELSPFAKPKTHSEWSTVSILQMSIGYEVQISPMQLLTFYNGVANDGIMLKPRLVRAYSRNGVITKEITPDTLSHSICTKSTLEKVQELLAAAVDNGTGSRIKSDRYKIAGKTGTTKYHQEGVGYNGEHRGSFVGYFPADKPKYSCIVVVNRPKGDYYGSKVAAPVFKDIADKLYSYDPDMNTKPIEKKWVGEAPISRNGYKIDTDIVLASVDFDSEYSEEIHSSWVNTSKLTNTVSYSNYKITKGIVPSVKGMGAKDAIFLLESMGIKTKVKGFGEVKKQSIPAGRKIRKGDVINLTLG